MSKQTIYTARTTTLKPKSSGGTDAIQVWQS